MKSLVFLCGLVQFCHCITNLADNYPFNATLKAGEYYLYWNFSNTDDSIQFAVRVRTTGWIGFGLSPSGQMIDSDVVIGWIGDNTSYFHDRFAFEQQLPPIDPVQNWFLTNSEVEDDYTQLEFYRDFVTCDDRDRDILADTSRVVFSWNDNKPTVTRNSDGSESYSISRHQERGSTSINLRGGLPTPPDIPSDAKSFIVGVEEVEIPATDTQYYCKGIRFDENIRDQEQYIIKISPSISADSAAYVHHMLVYVCDGLQDDDLGAGGDCDTAVSERVQNCLGSILIAAWAVGGGDFIYPENVAYPIGGPNDDKQYAVIQVHYNNPDEDSGVLDSSGLEFTYISTAREYDAGILFLGHNVVPTMVIPPGSPNYTITSFCSSQCTDKYFPADGIHIFANMLHTHLLGTGLELSVVDETQCPATGQSRTEQTQIIERNLHYDFNFQQANHLSEEIIVKPGSTMLLNCYYDSSRRSGATLGGESTHQEMCLSFPVYYPRVDMTHCTSLPTFIGFGNFIENYVPEEYRDQFEQLQPDVDPDDLAATLDLLEWNNRQLQGLYDAVYKDGSQYGTCFGNSYNVNLTYSPNLCCAYETENQCTGSTPTPCCDRTCLSTPGGVAMTTTSVSLLAITLLTTLYYFL